MSSKKTGMEKRGDKCRKSPKVKQSKTPPKYRDAIQTAIISLKEKGGSSEKSILKFICANFNVGDEKAASKHLKLALKAAIKDGTLKQSPGNMSHRLYCLGNANRKLPKSVASKSITKRGSSNPSEKTAKKHNKNQAKNEVVRGAVKKSKQSKASLKGKQSKQTIKKPSKAFMKGKQSEQTIKKPSKASMKGKQPKQSIKKPSKAYVKGKQSKQSMVGSPKNAKVTNTSKVKKRKRPNEKTVARQSYCGGRDATGFHFRFPNSLFNGYLRIPQVWLGSTKTITAAVKKRDNQNQSNKAAIAHPRYSEMIQDAINCLHSRKGSSRHAILKFIVGKYKLCNESLANKRLKMTLKTEIKRGSIKNATGEGASGSFKLVKAARRPSKKPTKSRNQIKSPKLKATKRKKSILSQKASSMARSGNQMKYSTQHNVLKKITEKSRYKTKESKSDKQRPIVKKTLNNTTKSKTKRPNAAVAERAPQKARKNKGYIQNMAVVGKAQEDAGNTLRSKQDKNMKHPALNNADTRKLLSSFDVKLIDDLDDCFICGLDVMLNGTIIIADYNNMKIKLFDGGSMEHLSSVRMLGEPSEVAVSASIDNEAIVSLWHENKIAFLDLNDVYKPFTKEILQLEYPVIAAIEYGVKIIAISHDIPSVKLIDRTGRLFWSTSLAQSPQTPTFPGYITPFIERGRTVCVISDAYLGTLTKLGVKSGNILKTYKGFKDVPAGICADGKGTIYVCYDKSFDVTTLSTDFARETILLSQKDGVKADPSCVRYNSMNGMLLISYDGRSSSRNCIDCFKLG